jgi:hypothetical protein
MDLSLQQLERAFSIRKRIAQLESQFARLFWGPTISGSGKRTMSAASRRKIAAAQRARWAKVKGSKGPGPKRKKSGLTPAGRRKLSQMMKARWAARRKAKKK